MKFTQSCGCSCLALLQQLLQEVAQLRQEVQALRQPADVAEASLLQALQEEFQQASFTASDVLAAAAEPGSPLPAALVALCGRLPVPIHLGRVLARLRGLELIGNRNNSALYRTRR